MDLKLKKATEKDIELIAQLADKIWRDHYATIISIGQINYMLKEMYSAESLLKQMNEGHQFTLVYNNDKPVGYLSIDTKDGKNYFLHKLYIEVEEHAKGIGSKLFDHALNEIPTAETIELFVNRENIKAINFYFKKGFVIKEIINQDIGAGYFMNDFIMIKNIYKSH
jgi:ribosomal protein S18 acetylase RimI-like enzyme